MSILRFFSKRLLTLGLMSALILPTQLSQAGIAQTIRNIPNNKYIQMGIQGLGLAYCYYVNKEYGQLLKKEDDSYGGGDKSLSTIYRNMRLIHTFGGLICVRELYNTYYRTNAKPSENTTNTVGANSTVEQISTSSATSSSLTPINDSNSSPSQSPALVSNNSTGVQISDNGVKTQTTNDTAATESNRWQRLTAAANRTYQHVQDRFSGEKSAKVADGLRFCRKWGWIGARAGFVMQWPFAECNIEYCHRSLTGCIHCWANRVVAGMAIQSLYNQYYSDTNNGSTVARETNNPVAIPSTIPATAPEPKQPAADLTQNAGSPVNNGDSAAQSPGTAVSG